MTDEDRMADATDMAVHAEGTRDVFDRRAKALSRLTRLRDFWGLAVPVCLAYLLGSDIFDPLKAHKAYAVGALGFSAAIQALLALWSLIARWDDSHGDAVRSASENYLLKEEWKRIARGDARDICITYDIVKSRQDKVDVRDSEKGISDREKRRGMRAGLIEFQRSCICGTVPSMKRLPIWPKKSCAVCGGT